MELSYGKIVLLLLLILLVFGSRKLPSIGRDLGLAFHNLKNAVRRGEDKDKPNASDHEHDNKS